MDCPTTVEGGTKAIRSANCGLYTPIRAPAASTNEPCMSSYARGFHRIQLSEFSRHWRKMLVYHLFPPNFLHMTLGKNLNTTFLSVNSEHEGIPVLI